jgi:hypothetical protein
VSTACVSKEVIPMRPSHYHAKHEKRPPHWIFLSAEEKKAEFKELVASPYWHFLPEELKDRLLRFLHD